MRKRRKSGGSWFPLNPTVYAEGFPGVTWTDETITVVAGLIDVGVTAIKAIPLTLDATIDVNQAGPDVTLRDFVQGQDYVAKRIVGDVWFNAPDSFNQPNQQVVRSVCNISLAVLPVDDVDTESPAMLPDDYHPLLAQNAQAPWLFRRSWQLGDANLRYIPASTGHYGGGAYGGGHLDTKGTLRRITKEQRLYLIAAVGILEIGPDAPAEIDSVWEFGYDLRLFGQMRSSRNRSTFK